MRWADVTAPGYGPLLSVAARLHEKSEADRAALEESLAVRDVAIRDAVQGGASTRQVATALGLSHSIVARIARRGYDPQP